MTKLRINICFVRHPGDFYMTRRRAYLRQLSLTMCCSGFTRRLLLVVAALMLPLMLLLLAVSLFSRPREAINFCIIPRWFGFTLKRRFGEIWKSWGVERARVNAFDWGKMNWRFPLGSASWPLAVPFIWLLTAAASILSFRLDTDGECTGLGESESPESSELADDRQSSLESFSWWPCRSSCSRLATSFISSCIRFRGSSVCN